MVSHDSFSYLHFSSLFFSFYSSNLIISNDSSSSFLISSSWSSLISSSEFFNSVCVSCFCVPLLFFFFTVICAFEKTSTPPSLLAGFIQEKTDYPAWLETLEACQSFWGCHSFSRPYHFVLPLVSLGRTACFLAPQ